MRDDHMALSWPVSPRHALSRPGEKSTTAEILIVFLTTVIYSHRGDLHQGIDQWYSIAVADHGLTTMVSHGSELTNIMNMVDSKTTNMVEHAWLEIGHMVIIVNLKHRQWRIQKGVPPPPHSVQDPPKKTIFRPLKCVI